MGTRTAERGGVAGIVLAGGLSSRMGRDKALLVQGGETLLARAIRVLAEAGAGPIRISGDYPDAGGIPDAVERMGPIGGLFSVLPTLDDGWAWVMPVDMPHVGVEELHQLRDAALGLNVRFVGQPLPMLLKIDQNCRTLLAQVVADPDGSRSIHRLQQALGVHEVAIAEGCEARLLNCNTPGQWKDAET